ncbi:MAG: IMP cyclohydrolase, partial [Halobacteria archaeon]|nr:IMP cyclohydrolase [Halobacteria archaeon]
DDTLAVVPEEEYDNPYVSYNCLRRAKNKTVISNGTHTDPIAEKIELGYPARDALALSLLAMDFEKDDYDTPRIAGVVDSGAESYIGIVTRDSLIVESVDEPTLVATYEEQKPRPIEFAPTDADDAARRAYGLDYEHPVAACAVFDDELGIYNG